MSVHGNENLNDDTPEESNVQNDMWKLVQLASTNDGLLKMRVSSEYRKEFDTFINYCLVHFTQAINWRYKSYNSNVSDIFTESDESLCILILENNAEDFVNVFQTKTKITRKNSKTKYTKNTAGMNTKFKGWNRDGIKRFNYIVVNIKSNRQSEYSKELESNLRTRYEEIFRDINGGKGEDLILQENNDESSDEEVEAYDGFSGVDILTTCNNITQV